MMKDKVVICADAGKWYLATRKLFDNEGAAKYAGTIHPSRTPRIVSVEELILMLPKGLELKPSRE